MKILIATDFYIHNLGGVTSSVVALCTGLRELGHEVKILTLSDHNESFKDNDDYYIRSFKAYYSPGMRLSFSFNDPLINELEKWKPDIVHVQSEASVRIMAKKISRKCAAPLVMTCHTDYAYFTFGRFRNSFAVRLSGTIVGKMIYTAAAKVVIPSEKARNFPFLSAVQDRLVVIANGIELNKYQKKLSKEEKRQMKEAMGIGEDEKLLVTITRLSKEKNIEELISYLPELLKRIEKVRLLIVGDGPDQDHLKKLAEKHHLCDHVVFAGRQQAKEVWRYYDLADVFVSASTFEVHSMSNLEALALGLPLLCRADEALNNVLEHDVNGFRYFSCEEFTDYACRLLSDDELRKQMGNNSLMIANEFSAEKFAGNMIGLYESLVYDEKAS